MKILQHYAKPLVWLSALLMTALVAGCGGGEQGRDPILGLPAAELVRVAVTPATASIPIGGNQQFVANATFADGASRDVTALSSWSSGAPAIGALYDTTGMAIGVASGTAVITATYQGKAGSATLTVSSAVLRSLALTPATSSVPTGGAQQFLALGTFSDGATRDITAISRFTSAQPGTAAIAAVTGLATGVSTGSSVISAASGAQSATAMIAVKPTVLASIFMTPFDPVLQIGATRQIAVMGLFSDGEKSILPPGATFSASAPELVNVGASSGLMTGIAAGSSTITASYQGKTAATGVTVLSTSLSSIRVAPSSAGMVVGGVQGFAAIGTFADGSTGDISGTVNWTSSDTVVATILPTGVASGLLAGRVIMTATSGAKAGSATLNVMPVSFLSSIAVVPASTMVSVGAMQQFSAIATYGDGSTSDVTSAVDWTSSRTNVATVLAGGAVNGVHAGTAVIGAGFHGIGGTYILTVDDAP